MPAERGLFLVAAMMGNTLNSERKEEKRDQLAKCPLLRRVDVLSEKV